MVRAPDGRQSVATDEGPETVLLDAWAVINLCASRHFEDILSDLPYRFAVAEKVSTDETLYVRRGGGGEDALEKEPLKLDPSVSAGNLQVLPLLSDDEATTFVSLTTELDDGEAATIAIALHRKLSVATDDRKARSRLRQANVRSHSTLALLKEWCETRGLSSDEIATVLSDVRHRGSFLPPRGEPLQNWWDTYSPSGR